MKFAKQLQQERCSEWSDQYLDYKLMKKVTKQGESRAVPRFYSLLNDQLRKIKEFLKSRQAAIAEAIDEDIEIGHAQGPSEQLVRSIEQFMNFAMLNNMAIRKILKRFTKRFPLQLQDHRIVSVRCLVGAGDIAAWLLEPAQRRLTLTLPPRSPGGSLLLGTRPQLQFFFWTEELKVGCLLVDAVISGFRMPSPTPLRLRRLGCRDGEVDAKVRHTFISCVDIQEAALKRTVSAPPTFGANADQPLSGDVEMQDPANPQNVEMEDLASPQNVEMQDPASPQNVELEDPASPQNVEMEDLASPQSPTSPSQRRGSSAGESDAGVEADEDIEGDELPARVIRTPGRIHRSSGAASSSSSQMVAPGSSPSSRMVSDRGQPSGLQRPFQESTEAVPRRRYTPVLPRGSATRWWMDCTEPCPLTGMPVNLLPYPPFKLQRQRPGGTRESVLLVDGLFLALSVLSTWRFEVFGRPLTDAEVEALDAYVKKCKLGPFKLGRAMRLATSGSPEDRRELENLRARAQQRLQTLRYVQRARLTRA